eukprot:1153366-Pelagomonas_calceolata.AAC.3
MDFDSLADGLYHTFTSISGITITFTRAHGKKQPAKPNCSLFPCFQKSSSLLSHNDPQPCRSWCLADFCQSLPLAPSQNPSSRIDSLLLKDIALQHTRTHTH